MEMISLITSDKLIEQNNDVLICLLFVISWYKNQLGVLLRIIFFAQTNCKTNKRMAGGLSYKETHVASL